MSRPFFTLFLAGFLMTAAPVLAQDTARIVTTGTGQISVAPDMAQITIGVQHRADNPTDAINLMSDATQAVLGRLAQVGIAEKDVQTSSLRLDLEQDYNSSTGRARITGYMASTSITVAVLDLEKLGEILGQVVTDGANQIDDLRFDVADRKPHLEAARRAAVAEARDKAAIFADAAGVKLGALISLSESGAGAGPGQPMYDMPMALEARAVPVAAGEIDISASVTLVYAIGA